MNFRLHHLTVAGLCLAILSGCIAPLGQREAQRLAAAELKRFCRDSSCDAFHPVAAQKIKDRWLVDFESPSRKYTVTVNSDGNSDVSVWDKNPAR